MRNAAIVILFIVAFVLGIAGIFFLSDASSGRPADEVGARAMISGMTCLGLGSVFLVTGSILAFLAGKKGDQADTQD